MGAPSTVLLDDCSMSAASVLLVANDCCAAQGWDTFSPEQRRVLESGDLRQMNTLLEESQRGILMSPRPERKRLKQRAQAQTHEWS